jgi:D-serine/D-alanine/glycine transporter
MFICFMQECNSGIFANSRTMYGLAGRKQGPPFLHKTNKHGVPQS